MFNKKKKKKKQATFLILTTIRTVIYMVREQVHSYVK